MMELHKLPVSLFKVHYYLDSCDNLTALQVRFNAVFGLTSLRTLLSTYRSFKQHLAPFDTKYFAMVLQNSTGNVFNINHPSNISK